MSVCIESDLCARTLSYKAETPHLLFPGARDRDAFEAQLCRENTCMIVNEITQTTHVLAGVLRPLFKHSCVEEPTSMRAN
jgi:hypothetical protein